MTPEEAKALQKGDNVIIHAVIEDAPDVRDPQAFWVEAGSKDKTCLCVAVEDISVPAPKPKYDPCRKYWRGDKVNCGSKLGRFVPHIPNGAICTVLADEKDGRVHIEYCDNESIYTATIPFFFLELITPVEELEPYRVELCQDENPPRLPSTAWGIFKGAVIVAKFYIDFLSNAKDLAEAECKRLNAEYRKDNN